MECHSYLFHSTFILFIVCYSIYMLIGVIFTFKSDGIDVNGRLLDSRSISGNLNAFNYVESFMEISTLDLFRIAVCLKVHIVCLMIK